MIRDLLISQLGLMGQGVGYDEGFNIYFVTGALPGDLVRVEYSEEKKRYRETVLLKIVKPSPQRVIPPCPYFGECGGCDFMDLEYAEQVKHKAAALSHLLAKAPLVPEEIKAFIPSPRIYGYRSRIQLKRRENLLGFYKKKSHDLVGIEKCAIADERLNENLTMLYQHLSDRNFKSVELIAAENSSVTRVYDAPQGAVGFTQVNVAQNENLKAQVTAKIREVGAHRVLELFCGDGNLSFAFAPYVSALLGIDANLAAIEKARNLLNGKKNISFERSEVSATLAKKLASSVKDPYDTLVLDPPRTGAGGSLELFVQNAITNIIYISCSPLSFSIDLRVLKKSGISTTRSSGVRHVSPHATYRIDCAPRAKLAAFFFLILFLANASFAEDLNEGNALELGREAVVRSAPESDAPPLGRLPAGTILSSKGQKKGKFILIEVELENEETLEGWINVSTLKDPENVESVGEEKVKSEVPVKRKRKRRVQVPQDELAVLKREPSFVYGVQLGGNYSFISTASATTGTSNTYQNPGIAADLEGGIFLTKEIPLMLQVGYSQANGISNIDTTSNISFGFLNVAVIPSYVIDPVEIFVGVEYSLGIGINSQPLPAGVTLTSPSQLSSLGALAGVGYRIPLGYYSQLALRLKYAISLIQTPFSFSSVTACVALEFRG